ncbi:tetratricopeptide repeat protein [Myxosarcina sp. GI1]|uniref:tetratricopeptide repeat protein n=1 Tax=Myxosarcina sp. GI1 TaxID=1541065 RepID=UPI000569FEEA|nr:tetratricopeptide repeat protein [Myxosarcina sp. GI1]
MKNKTFQRIITLIFGLAFIGSTGAIVLAGLFDNQKPVAETAVNPQSSEKQIQSQIRGYEKVLEREPENLTALNGLAQLYLQTGNAEAAIAPLEKLARLQPQQQEYQQILQVLKQQQNSTIDNEQ